jgi:hypothetical protein
MNTIVPFNQVKTCLKSALVRVIITMQKKTHSNCNYFSSETHTLVPCGMGIKYPLRVLENNVLDRTFEPKREEVRGK